MTKDETYEAAVTTLERRWATQIANVAAAAARLRGHDYDSSHDQAHDAVVSFLLNLPEWAGVEAVDISDIAYEAATEAVRVR